MSGEDPTPMPTVAVAGMSTLAGLALLALSTAPVVRLLSAALAALS